MSGTHDPAAIERIAEALANHDSDANYYWDDEHGDIMTLTWDDIADDDDDWIDRGGDEWTKGRPYYRKLAAVALRAIDALYDEGGEPA